MGLFMILKITKYKLSFHLHSFPTVKIKLWSKDYTIIIIIYDKEKWETQQQHITEIMENHL